MIRSLVGNLVSAAWRRRAGRHGAHASLRGAGGIGTVFMLIVPWSLASGQVVNGWVLDSATNTGLSGAAVTVISATGDTLASVRTTATGLFTYRGQPGRDVVFSILRLGYVPKVSSPVGITTEPVEFRTTMKPLPVGLDPIMVEAYSAAALAEMQYLQDEGFFERSKSLWGRFLSPERIDELRDRVRVADDFVRHGTFITPIAGSTRRGYRLRCGQPRLYVDGRRFYGEDLDQAAHQDDVLAIEIIEDRDIFVPFYGNCAILLWTKDGPGN